MQFIPFLLGSMIIINIFLAFTIIFLERKDASSTWAWLMVLLFIPIAGFILYLIFGKKIRNRRIFTWYTKSKLGVKKAAQEHLHAIKNDNFTYKYQSLAYYKVLYLLNLCNNDVTFILDNI